MLSATGRSRREGAKGFRHKLESMTHRWLRNESPIPRIFNFVDSEPDYVRKSIRVVGAHVLEDISPTELNTLKDDLKPARSQLAPSILNYGVDKVAEIFMEGEILSFIAGMRILIQVTTLQVEIGGESYHYVTRSEATDEDDSDSSKSADADNAVPTTQSRATGNVTARSPSASILPSNPETTAEREHIEADIAMEDKIAGEDDDVDYEGDTSGSECESADENDDDDSE